MGLTIKQLAFAKAYAGPARRSAELAAAMTGTSPKMIEVEAVQAYVEQISFEPTIVAGEVLDVQAVQFDEPVPEESVSRLEGLRKKLQGAATRAGIGLGGSQEVDPMSIPSATSQSPVAVNQYGETVGTAEEAVARATRAARRVADPTKLTGQSVETATVALAERLVDPEVIPVVEHADGRITKYTTEVATPFEVKKFLTEVMRGELTMELDRRLQAAALLAKAHGMLSERLIAEDRQQSDLSEQSAEQIRSRLGELRLLLASENKQPDAKTDGYALPQEEHLGQKE